MTVRIIQGDCRETLKTLADESVNCCVTSPPYWGLRDYGNSAQIGQEKTPDEYVAELVAVFQEVRRVLRDDGTLWLNLGDSYAGGGRGGNPAESAYRKQATNAGSLIAASPIPKGIKPKDLVGIPWMMAFALRADGWWLRQEIIWHKPNPMPESVQDRCTKAHEQIFLLTKSERYYYDAAAIKEAASENTNPRRAGNGYKTPDGWDTSKGSGGHGSFHKDGREKGHTGYARKGGRQGEVKNNASFDEAMAIMPEDRNKRSVWTVPTAPYKGSHFATFPPDLIRPCVLAGCPQGGVVLDPFGGSGTVGEVAEEEGRNSVLVELSEAYVKLIEKRTAQGGLFCGAAS
jgi:DNA modification methylase